MKLKLDWCSHRAALSAVKNYHYSQSMPVGKSVKIGVWEDDKFIGVVIFSRGANRHMLLPFNLKQNDGCELTRIALSKHTTNVSRIISIAIKMLKRKSPGLKLIVSYADSRQNHLGKVYQASNWIYTGKAITTPDYFYNGRWVHMRTVSAAIKRKKVKRDIWSHLKKKDGGFRLRYIYPLDTQTRQNVLKLSKEYPSSLASVV